MDIYTAGIIGIFFGGVIGAAALKFLPRNNSHPSRNDYEKIQRQAVDFKAQRDALEKTRIEARSDNERLHEQLQETKERAASLETEKRLLNERLGKHEEELKALHERNRQEFKNLATEILEGNSKKFNEHSQKSLLEMLNPLKDRFGEFQKNVGELFEKHGKEQFGLKEEIHRIVAANEKMTLQADNLTKALKGDVKAQGTWGEVILERILEEAGLQKEFHYTVQGIELGLKHVEDGSALKPDVIIHLPENKHLIVDSKVSLTHYERYCGETAEDVRDTCLKQYLQSMRNHINGLAQRRYQDTDKLGTPDFVLMFMPIEGAYSLAIQQDRELHSYAWDKKVVVVCPSTLFATLRTIASVWNIELRNRNAQKIAEQGGKLYDKLVGFIDDMQAVGTHLEKAVNAHHNALSKLSTGRGNVLRQAEQMKEFGAKTSKTLPSTMLEDELQEEDKVLPILVSS